MSYNIILADKHKFPGYQRESRSVQHPISQLWIPGTRFRNPEDNNIEALGRVFVSDINTIPKPSIWAKYRGPTANRPSPLPQQSGTIVTKMHYISIVTFFVLFSIEYYIKSII